MQTNARQSNEGTESEDTRPTPSSPSSSPAVVVIDGDENVTEDTHHYPVGECYAESLLNKHLERQTLILQKLVGGENSDAIIRDFAGVGQLGELLERSLFTPPERPQGPTASEPDPRLNFYPPFLTPECLALHYPFFMNIPIPRSCKANRVGTGVFAELAMLDKPVSYLPDPTKLHWNDEIGKVDLIAELKDQQKLALLRNDYARLRWCKAKALNMTTFAFPCIALPPSLQKLLVEVFVGRAQAPNTLDKQYVPAVTEDLLESIWGRGHTKEGREAISVTVTQHVLLHIMQKFFNDKQTVRNVQESLHYTFGHGFVRMIRLLTETDLSEFVTYHGLTHRNRLNNPRLQEQLEDNDKVDYVLDSIYLFLVFTWQTAMDIWQQTLDDTTLVRIKEALEGNKKRILNLKSVFKMSKALAEIIYPPIVHKTFSSNLPDFISQSQLNHYRLFVMSKSGVPQCVSPLLPSDMVPCVFEEAHPILWSHVFLLRTAAFLKNQGCYAKLHECNSQSEGFSAVLCECNLCSPHRMPAYNTALLQEISSINKIHIQQQNEDSSASKFALTPQAFANAYLKKAPSDDFFHDRICLYRDTPEAFREPLEACVIKNPKLLAVFKEAEVQRERELLKRGRGVYLDPQTGEQLNEQVVSALQADERPNLDDGNPICTTIVGSPDTSASSYQAIQAADNREGSGDASASSAAAHASGRARGRRRHRRRATRHDRRHSIL